VLETQDLTIRFGGHVAVDRVSCAFQPGTLTAIVGPNGAGKSTLLKAALGLIPATAGEVRAFGQPAAAMLPRIAYVPQRASVDWDFPARALDVVMMGAWRRTGLLGRLGGEKARALECLARVGMQDFAARQIGALSGGQQQRVFLARALMQGADLYLLDEPFAGVDAATEAAIIDLLHDLRDEGRSVVAVHHDLSTVAGYFDRVFLLNRQAVAEGPVGAVFRRELVSRTYGGQLPAALPA
jgi:manganese/zinc/iron transport system ATP- binding protein